MVSKPKEKLVEPQNKYCWTRDKWLAKCMSPLICIEHRLEKSESNSIEGYVFT